MRDLVMGGSTEAAALLVLVLIPMLLVLLLLPLGEGDGGWKVSAFGQFAGGLVGWLVWLGAGKGRRGAGDLRMEVGGN